MCRRARYHGTTVWATPSPTTATTADDTDLNRIGRSRIMRAMKPMDACQTKPARSRGGDGYAHGGMWSGVCHAKTHHRISLSGQYPGPNKGQPPGPRVRSLLEWQRCHRQRRRLCHRTHRFRVSARPERMTMTTKAQCIGTFPFCQHCPLRILGYVTPSRPPCTGSMRMLLTSSLVECDNAMRRVSRDGRRRY